MQDFSTDEQKILPKIFWDNEVDALSAMAIPENSGLNGDYRCVLNTDFGRKLSYLQL